MKILFLPFGWATFAAFTRAGVAAATEGGIAVRIPVTGARR